MTFRSLAPLSPDPSASLAPPACLLESQRSSAHPLVPARVPEAHNDRGLDLLLLAQELLAGGCELELELFRLPGGGLELDGLEEHLACRRVRGHDGRGAPAGLVRRVTVAGTRGPSGASHRVVAARAPDLARPAASGLIGGRAAAASASATTATSAAGRSARLGDGRRLRRRRWHRLDDDVERYMSSGGAGAWVAGREAQGVGPEIAVGRVVNGSAGARVEIGERAVLRRAIDRERQRVPVHIAARERDRRPLARVSVNCAVAAHGSVRTSATHEGNSREPRQRDLRARTARDDQLARGLNRGAETGTVPREVR